MSTTKNNGPPLPAMVAESLATAYQSERLIYRAPENNDEDKAFLHALNGDAVIAALVSKRLIMPRNQNLAAKMIEIMQISSLAVFVCLPAGDETTGGRRGDGDDKTVGKEAAKPTTIGLLILGIGGIDADNARHRHPALAVSLAAPFQNKGYGGEAINWGLDWAFRFGGFHRVSIVAWSYNERAIHLYKRLGFVEEGRTRESIWLDRKWYDEVNLGMLESDWEALRGLGKAE